MQRAPLIHIVVGQSVSIFELFIVSVKEALLIWRNTLLILNLGLNIQYRVVMFKVKGDDLFRLSLNEDIVFCAITFLFRGITGNDDVGNGWPEFHWRRMAKQLMVSSESSSVPYLLTSSVVSS